MAEEAVKRAGTKITFKYFSFKGGLVAREISANIKKIAFHSALIENQSRGVLRESIVCPNHFVAPSNVYDSSG